jgi:hypothetical protein
MASTYTYGDSIAMVATVSPRAMQENNGAMLCDKAVSMIWSAADWRQSLTTLPPFYLTPGDQDYGAPMSVVPSDFLGLRQAYVTYLGQEPPSHGNLLEVRSHLDLTHEENEPTLISYLADARRFRIWHRFPNSCEVAKYMVEGTYKKAHTKVVADNLNSVALPFDDDYFRVFCEVLKYQVFSATGDPRAGEIVAGRRGQNPTYTKQLGVAWTCIGEMMDHEAVQFGAEYVSPAEAFIR